VLTATGLCIAGLIGAALYGWWHRVTHATLEVQLVFNRGGGTANRLRNGQLEFLDAEGAVLARATIDTRRGVVWLAHPERGQCGPTLEREARDACYRVQAEWIPGWAERVKSANVALEGCSFARVPVTLYTRRDSVLLWWTPIAERRGRPFTRHIATVTANQRACGA
jgi:hypothetical protein